MTAHGIEQLAALANTFSLSPGNHASRDDGMCAMELVAFLDGVEHTDRPRCVSETISDFVRFTNDHIPDYLRPRLLPFVPRLLGTADREHEQARIEAFAWTTIRVFAPAALRATGLRRAPAKLEKVQDFQEAKHRALEIAVHVNRRYDFSPAYVAVWRASQAAGFARCTARDPHDLGCYFGEVIGAGHLAASACYQAHCAGAGEDIWQQALNTLDAVLRIGAVPTLTLTAVQTVSEPVGKEAIQ
jgi:hypothetical protein